MPSTLFPPSARRTLVALAAAALLTASACGSTARQVTAYTYEEGGGPATSGEGDGPSFAGADGEGDDGVFGDGSGDGPAGSDPSSPRTRRSSGPRSGGSGSRNDGSSSSTPGVTDTAIKLGIVAFVNTDQMTSQVSPSLGLFGDFKAYYTIAIKDLNDRGGVLGRKIEPVYRDYDSSRSDTSVQAQANCDALTNDTKVFAVLMPGRQSDTFRSCLERAGVVHMAMGGSTGADERTFTQFRHYSEAGTLNLSRLASLQVEQLVAEGFLTSSSVIGVMTFDEPSHKRAYERHLKPALARHGLKVEKVAFAPYAENSAETGATTAAVQTAVVQFDTANVDRVLFIQSGVTLPLFFLTRASTQGYTPRYAINSSEAPSSLAGTPQTSSQLEGAMGVGWLPPTDLSAADDTVTPKQKACTDMMERGGQPVRYRSYAAAMYAVCDHVTLFAKALTGAGRPDRKAFMTALEAVDHDPTVTFGLRYGPGRHDGVAAVRMMRYFSECKCFRYISPIRAI